jgi:hypothetical protein
MLQLL